MSLKRFKMFDELTPEQRALLEDYLEPRKVSDGRILFGEREEAAELLLIVAGFVKLERGKRELGAVSEGAALGGVSLVRIGTRTLTARADGDVEALALSRESYLRLRADYPAVALVLQEKILLSLASSAERALSG